jgi:hypothetical protein
VVRETAQAITGEGESFLEYYPGGSQIALQLFNLLPRDLRIKAVEWGMSLGVGINPGQINSISQDALLSWCLDQYPARKYQAIIVGQPNGAVAHLAALLQAPFLSSSFAFAIRREKIELEDIQAYHLAGQRFASALAQTLPDFEIINHYDPFHDRNLVKFVNRIRAKLWCLPPQYQDFIKGHLAEGGKLILINCTFPWWQTRVGEREFLQIGGLGGISPEEYLKRFGEFLKSHRFTLEVRPESEWGTPEDFVKSVREFAERENIPLIEIKYERPEDYSPLAYRLYLSCEGVRKDWILFDNFNHQNPQTNIETGIPGFWLPFNTTYSYEVALGFLEGKSFERIYWTVLPSFAQSEDLVDLNQWQNLFSGHTTYQQLLGVDPRKFPADCLAPFKLARDLAGLRKDWGLDVPLRAMLSALEELLSR